MTEMIIAAGNAAATKPAEELLSRVSHQDCAEDEAQNQKSDSHGRGRTPATLFHEALAAVR